MMERYAVLLATAAALKAQLRGCAEELRWLEECGSRMAVALLDESMNGDGPEGRIERRRREMVCVPLFAAAKDGAGEVLGEDGFAGDGVSAHFGWKARKAGLCAHGAAGRGFERTHPVRLYEAEAGWIAC